MADLLTTVRRGISFLFLKWNLALYLLLFITTLQCLDFIVPGKALDADAQNYRIFAESMQHLYDTNTREPVWIWLVRLSLMGFRAGDNSIRYLGITLFILSCMALYVFIRNLFQSRWWGIAGTAFYALNTYLEQLASRGLRDNAFNLFFILMSMALFPGNQPKNRKLYLVYLSLITCVLVGVRINTFIPLIVVIPIAFRQMKIPVLWSSVPLVASLLLITPYLIYSQHKFQDALYSSNAHAKWWRNHEFVIEKKTGCDGCPTEQEMKEQGGYAGSSVTTYQYVFKMRTFKSLVADTVEGYSFLLIPPIKWLFALANKKANGGVFTRLFRVPVFPAEWFYLIGLLGIFFCSFRSIFFFPLLVTNFVPFTYYLGMDERIFSYLSPFMAIITVHGMILAIRVLSKLFQAVSKAKRSPILNF